MIEFFVPGTPVISSTVVDGRRQHLWRNDVRWAAREAVRSTPPLDDALQVTIIFFLARPSSVRRPSPSVGLDLARQMPLVVEALARARTWTYPARVVEITCRKAYVEAAPGVLVRVEEA